MGGGDGPAGADEGSSTLDPATSTQGDEQVSLVRELVGSGGSSLDDAVG